MYGLPSPDDCISSSTAGDVIGVAAVVGRADVVDRADIVGRAVMMVGEVMQAGPMNPGTQFTTNLTTNVIPATGQFRFQVLRSLN